MNEQVMVSVYCLAYNHENYIEDALKGFVNQKTNFRYEVFVHDDASSDGTADIIKRYAELYPNIIIPILQTENQYSKGVSIPHEFIFPRMKGKYIAMCEGDDYWTDENKLQKQFDALESHPECDLCSHNADFYDCFRDKLLKVVPNINHDDIIDASDVITNEGGFLHTASLFYRKEVRLNPMEFQNVWDLDYTIQIRGSLRGGIVFLKDNMSFYRWRVPGSSTVRGFDESVQMKLYEKKQRMLTVLNEETDYKYNEKIDKAMSRNTLSLNIYLKNYKEAFSKENRELFREIALIDRIKIYVNAYLPFVKKIRDSIIYLKNKVLR